MMMIIRNAIGSLLWAFIIIKTWIFFSIYFCLKVYNRLGLYFLDRCFHYLENLIFKNFLRNNLNDCDSSGKIPINDEFDLKYFTFLCNYINF